MKKYLKIIIYLAIFIVVIILATVEYKYLTSKYSQDIKQENKEEKLTQAKDFQVLNLEGKTINLSDYFGKPIVVNFWATWCEPCKMELSGFEEAYQKYNKDVEFLMVNLTDGYNDTIENVKEFVNENKYSFPLYFDTKNNAASTYNVYSIPQTLFINKEGEILKSYVGMINKKNLEQYIEKLKENQ